ncbi:hypothetical protein HPB48_016684 [Haemaphysalis longicornis]|uniref:Reverse transcriptase domain-containing protein n=1 Tax=Haemaphysalis longicornis TaxID=44386 RepID=A0A9J6F6J5_HAELO|nr:hypothetical protein HPB48_016684 [Haemaphysalis longicornis]
MSAVTDTFRTLPLPLCRFIRNDNTVGGISLADETVKVRAYADNLILVCASKEEMRKALQHLSEFCNVSGAKVNRDKWSGPWLGDWAPSQ